MKRLSLAVVALVLSALLVSPVLVSAQENDPGALLQALVDASNAHDIDAQAALFADDAVVSMTYGTEAETYTGAAEIRRWLEEDEAESPDARIEIADTQVNGDTATAAVSFYTADPQVIEAGLEPALATVEVVAKDGKVASMTVTADPEWLARAEEAMGAMMAETPTAAGPGEAETPAVTEGDQGAAMGDAGEAAMGPGKLPASGADSTNWLLVTLVGMLGVAGLGTGLWMRRRTA